MAPVSLLRLPVELLENVVRQCDQPERLGELFAIDHGCLLNADVSSCSTPSHMPRTKPMCWSCGSAAPDYQGKRGLPVMDIPSTCLAK